MSTPHVENPVKPRGPIPELPKSPEQPVVPPDDPHRGDIEREPNIDPPPVEPPVREPNIGEPPAPRA